MLYNFVFTVIARRGATKQSYPSSSNLNILNASSRSLPQNSSSALKSEQTFGLIGSPYRAHLKSSSKLTHLNPAGLPPCIPGIGDEIEIAIQQAPQFGLQSIDNLLFLQT
jgi:hypothetical protein